MSGDDWLGAALCVFLYGSLFWLIGWSPRRFGRMVRGLHVWLAASLAAGCKHQPNADLDEVLAFANARAKRLPWIGRS